MNYREIFQKYQRIAVVGISANPERPSHWIAKYLQEEGFEVTGVNPGLPKIPGIKVVKTVAEVDRPEIIDVFRSPDAIPALIEELIPVKPRIIWLQPGAQNPAAEKRAEALGFHVISGPCIYQEHKSL